MSRERRQEIAAETDEILRQGGYAAPGGGWVDLSDALASAKASLRCFDTDSLPALDDAVGAPPSIDVVGMTTFGGARDLLDDGAADVCCLNFASAKRAGGGYRSGAQAQEEALARASGLAPVFEGAASFYAAHRDAGSPLYADSVAIADHVPVFRDDHDALLAEPWSCALVSAAAPNRRALLQSASSLLSQADPCYRHRVLLVLRACRTMGKRTLVLGAWGCGVFGNPAGQAAAAWRDAVLSQEFAGTFDRVRFAIYDPSAKGVLQAFEEAFAEQA